MYEIIFELGKQLIEKGALPLALHPLRITRNIAPDTAEIDAYIAYILYRSDSKNEEFKQMVASALEGKSDSLFRLFNVPYSSDIMPNEFISRIGIN